MTVDPISPAVRTLLQIFQDDLDDVRFPDVDSAVLQQLCDDVGAQAEALHQAQLAVEQARQTLSDAQGQLEKKAKQALLYARVYAEDDTDLLERLADVSLGDKRKTSKTKSTKAKAPKTPKKRKAKSDAMPDLLSAAPAVAPANDVGLPDAVLPDTASDDAAFEDDVDDNVDEPVLVQALALDDEASVACVDEAPADDATVAA